MFKLLCHDLSGLVKKPRLRLSNVLPKDFRIPLGFESSSFRVRPLRRRDARADYDAVNFSRDRLRGVMGPDHPWPEPELRVVHNYLQLWLHEREFERKIGCAFTVETIPPRRCLGCVYIYPSKHPHYRIQVVYWVRADSAELDPILGQRVRSWLEEEWPFSAEEIAFPGREVSWQEYLGQ